MTNTTTLAKIPSYLVLFLAGVSPLLFVPLTADFFGLSKQFLFLAVAFLLMAIWAVTTIVQRRVVLSFSPFSTASLMILVTSVVSALLSVNPWQQLSGRFLTLLAFSLFVIFATSTARNLKWENILKVLLLIAWPLSLIFWWQLSPWPLSHFLNQILGTNFPADTAFSLLQAPLGLVSYLIPVGVSGFFLISTQPAKQRLFWLATVAVSLLTAAVQIWLMMTKPELQPLLLPYSFGWSMLVENFKVLRFFLIGVGPEQFLPAFHALRDVSFNTQEFWSLRFQTSSSEFLHTFTTLGILNVLSWFALFGSALVALRHLNPVRNLSLVSMFGLLVLQFFVLPYTVVSYILLALALIGLTTVLHEKHDEFVKEMVFLLSAVRIVKDGQVKTTKAHQVFSMVLGGIILLVVGSLFYLAGRAYVAHAYFYQSLLATQNNDAQGVYTWQQKAINANPFWTPFRRSYALTNLAIAQGIAEQSQQGELTQEQRDTFGQLLQQTIREARLAGQLNPTETENWETLAGIYSTLLDIEGAPDWAVLAMSQAIQTDPISPLLRLQLGNLYIQLGDAQQAGRLYEQAIQLKPDWHTAFFRYGQALEAQESPVVALQAYEKSLSLISADHEDYKLVEAKVNELRAKVQKSQEEAKSQEGNDNLTVPQQPTVPETEPTVTQPAEDINTDQGAQQILEQPSENIVLPENPEL